MSYVLGGGRRPLRADTSRHTPCGAYAAAGRVGVRARLPVHGRVRAWLPVRVMRCGAVGVRGRCGWC
ncbi:hypothetical protein, partial [Streptomyces acidicola]|uniref:hypothetical protein n=1 Tax=Streptomyces acidicola TaxID=2596892 RepID=UPI001D13EE41